MAAEDMLVDSEESLQDLIHDCRPQEQYTFIMEALCSKSLPSSVQLAAVRMLKTAILGIKAEKRYMYSSCLPMLLKRCANCEEDSHDAAQEDFIARLWALRDLASVFLAPCKEQDMDDEERSRKIMQGKVLRSMVTAFLLKLLQKAFPLLLPVTALDLEGSPPRLKLLTPEFRETNLEALCALGRGAAEASPRPMLHLLEEIELGDPQSDGGGDLETSPLSLAVFVLLAEVSAPSLVPFGLPLCISPARRANILMRSSYVLLCNGEAMPGVVNLADLGSLDALDSMTSVKKSREPCWAQRALFLFGHGAAPLLGLAQSELGSSLGSRWYPGRVFRKILESLTSTPDVEQKARGQLFRITAKAMRSFPWPSRSDLYLEIINQSRIDAVIGSIVTLFKDDWWRCFCEAPDGALKGQLLAVLKATLSGEVQIVDAMDTLTAALNMVRLVVLSKMPQAAPLKEALADFGLEAKLGNISKQIDAELGILAHESGTTSALLQSLGSDMDSLAHTKRERIAMVAHLVSRLREILAES
ncbi:unnamed protein product [Effrenium voratum]|nr:unnamed protein product [Effrenium voratum]